MEIGARRSATLSAGNGTARSGPSGAFRGTTGSQGLPACEAGLLPACKARLPACEAGLLLACEAGLLACEAGPLACKAGLLACEAGLLSACEAGLLPDCAAPSTRASQVSPRYSSFSTVPERRTSQERSVATVSCRPSA